VLSGKRQEIWTDAQYTCRHNANGKQGQTEQCQPVIRDIGGGTFKQPTHGLCVSEDECALHLLDGLCHLDIAWAGIRAVEDGTAAPHTGSLVENLKSLTSGGIAAIE